MRVTLSGDPMMARIYRVRSVEFVMTDAIDEKYRELHEEVDSVYELWREYRRWYANFRAEEALRNEFRESSAAPGSYEQLRSIYDNYRMDRLAAQERDLTRLIAELTSILSDYPITSEQPFSELRGKLTWPVAGTLLHDFGQPRAGGISWNGVVLAAPRGREVRAVYHGRVAFADWLAGMLSGYFAVSDENNALKLGYDPIHRRWPGWLGRLDIRPEHLPVVLPAGSPLGTLRGSLAKRWNLPQDMQVVAGTTDSTAGFIAAGADLTGTAVTALGSTLVIKVLSDQPVFAAHDGVYSHRLGERWLVGGASNAGGATLLKFFNRCDIRRYTRLIKPEQATGLDYYPLPATGERFPLVDPGLQPRLEPRPASDAGFFQAILEGLAAIEQRGYRLLAERGAPYPQRVLTVGGGAANAAWMQIRERYLAVPVTRATQQEAAFGAALLARGL